MFHVSTNLNCTRITHLTKQLSVWYHPRWRKGDNTPNLKRIKSAKMASITVKSQGIRINGPFQKHFWIRRSFSKRCWWVQVESTYPRQSSSRRDSTLSTPSGKSRGVSLHFLSLATQRQNSHFEHPATSCFFMHIVVFWSADSNGIRETQ